VGTEYGRKRRARRSPEALARIREERAEISDPTVVLEAALRFLEARQRSTVEVRTRLNRAGYRPDLVEGSITRLIELGMLDDRAFAQAWVESRDRAHPRGERALQRELRMKGIEREVIEGALEDRAADRPEADLAAAARLLTRNASQLARVADLRARRQRAYALLGRNGFDSETAVSAINAWLAGPDDAPDDEPGEAPEG
jgi:regulatory protein